MSARRAAAAATLAVAALCAGCGGKAAAPPPPPAQHPAATGGGTPLADAPPAPDFALRDSFGRPVRLSALRGDVVLVTFLYTSCTDVCPVIAEALNRAVQSLGPARQEVRVLAVSVDPRGDTPARVGAYRRIHRLVPQFRYLIGTRAELQPVWQDYNVLVEPRNEEFVGHGAPTYLIDRAGRLRISYDDVPQTEAVARDVRSLLG